MADKEILKTILGELKDLNKKVDNIQEDTKVTRSVVNSLIEWADDVGVITSVKFPVKTAE